MSVFFILATLVTEVQFLIFILLCNELNIADREGQWILQFQMIPGVRGIAMFFILAKSDYRRTFRTVLGLYQLLCNGVNIADKEL